MKTMTTQKNNALYQYIKSFFYFIICCQTVVSVVCVVRIASVGKNTPALVRRIFFLLLKGCKAELECTSTTG